MNRTDLRTRLVQHIDQADDAMLMIYFKIIVGERLPDELARGTLAAEPDLTAQDELLDRYEAYR